MKNKEIKLSPTKSTCIIQVQAVEGELEQFSNNMNYLTDSLTGYLTRGELIKGHKVEEVTKTLYSYYHDPIYIKILEQLQEREKYLRELEKPTYDEANGIMALPAVKHTVKRLSYQI